MVDTGRPCQHRPKPCDLGHARGQQSEYEDESDEEDESVGYYAMATTGGLGREEGEQPPQAEAVEKPGGLGGMPGVTAVTHAVWVVQPESGVV
jgi:hypothetical protein